MADVRFTEEMNGFVAFGADGYRSGWDEGKASDTSFMFHLTISVDDFDSFASDPLHQAASEGWLKAPALLAGEIPVTGGRFNLFAPGLAPGRTTMRYRLGFRDAGGNPLTMIGFKDVGDDPGFDPWRDTTSLNVSILDGDIEPAADLIGPAAEEGQTVRARGVVVVRPADFARQVTTFRGRPLAVARFSLMFAGCLWRTYASRATTGAPAA